MILLKWILWILLSCVFGAIAAVAVAGMIDDYHKRKKGGRGE